jgi:uncharacterized protein (TIGR04255 family)
MQFPEVPRVIYQNTPLVGVTCQLNFPAILKIDKDSPAEFQERIRHQYPVLHLESSLDINLPPPVNTLPARFGTQTYEFRDDVEDSTVWRVALTSRALVLSTTKYERWEEFKERLAVPLQALLDVYSPAFFERLGLRYQNAISRSQVDMPDTPWRDLLNPAIGGLFNVVDDEKDIGSTQNITILRLNTGPKVRLQHGLVTLEDETEARYLIDQDFFIDRKTEVADVTDTLNILNKSSGWLFRWCISDRLHSALEPSRLD